LDRCEQGATKYQYNVEYHGIGLLSNRITETENGHCTQACVFTRQFLPKHAEEEHGQPHQLIKHIEFPYYKEPPLTKEQTVDELEVYIETFCQAENYYEQKPPSFSYYSRQEEELAVDIDLITDWDAFNISNYNIPSNSDTIYGVDPSPVKYTSTPISISLSSLWNILRIRQICKNEDYLKAILMELCSSYPEDFHWKQDDSTLIVYKSYKLKVNNDDSNSISSVSTIEE
jgi:hypothetical protein